jgi:hypothetical protein
VLGWTAKIIHESRGINLDMDAPLDKVETFINRINSSLNRIQGAFSEQSALCRHGAAVTVDVNTIIAL